MLQRSIPLTIVFITGVLLLIQYFVPHKISRDFYRLMLEWRLGVTGFAIVLAAGSLIRHHIRKLQKGENTVYSITTLLGILFMTLAGLIGGIGEESLFQKVFENVQIPLQATMFSLLAFFMASAAYRAFRARTMEATLLLLAAFVVMIGMIPLGYVIHPRITDFAFWILNVPNLAAKRGIMIGVGLGMISTALKIIFGVERNWLGR